MHHEDMAASVDLVPGDSTSGSGNPTNGRYAQIMIRLHLCHHFQHQAMSASRPQPNTAYPPAHNSHKQNTPPSFYTNTTNHW